MLRRSFLLRTSSALCPDAFLRNLTAAGFTSYFGVPDSLLKELCKCITFHGDSSATAALEPAKKIPIEHHLIAANEGNAIGLAAGYHLAHGTNKFPVVYMQNSGLGNCVNPLTSLTHSEVYRLPMLLVVGWRGMPSSKKDEPQHVAMGRLTTNILDACEVPHALLPKDDAAARCAVQEAARHLSEKKTPYALLVDRDTFAAPPEFVSSGSAAAGGAQPSSRPQLLELTREGAIEKILQSLPSNCPVVGNTGMISREVFETRKRLGQSNASDFLTVGAMGHASSIAAGIVLGQQSTTGARKVRKVVCLDGDGAFIMHMGAAAVLGGSTATKDNLIHIVLNNGAHDSVGGQPTVGFQTNLTAVAKACGYSLLSEKPVCTEAELDKLIETIVMTCKNDAYLSKEPIFVEVRVKKGNRKDLGRPTSSAGENRVAFMDFLKQ